MLKNLQQQIRQRLIDKRISANALERRAGLKTSAVHNILQGKSKRPGVDILQAIAHELGCTISELLGEVPLQTDLAIESVKNETAPFDYVLYIEAIKAIHGFSEIRSLDLNKRAHLQLADEIYNYCSSGKLKNIDKHFAEWLLDRYQSTLKK